MCQLSSAVLRAQAKRHSCTCARAVGRPLEGTMLPHTCTQHAGSQLHGAQRSVAARARAPKARPRLVERHSRQGGRRGWVQLGRCRVQRRQGPLQVQAHARSKGARHGRVVAAREAHRGRAARCLKLDSLACRPSVAECWCTAPPFPAYMPAAQGTAVRCFGQVSGRPLMPLGRVVPLTCGAWARGDVLQAVRDQGPSVAHKPSPAAPCKA